MKYRRNKPKEALFPWKIWVEFPSFSVVKNLPVNAGDAGDMGSVPGSGRSPGEENGNPLQCSCLDNPMDRRTWWVVVHGVTEESDMTEQINKHTHVCTHTCTCAHTCTQTHSGQGYWQVMATPWPPVTSDTECHCNTWRAKATNDMEARKVGAFWKVACFRKLLAFTSMSKFLFSWPRHQWKFGQLLKNNLEKLQKED